MTGRAAGLEGAGNHRRALSRVGTGVGTAERCWRETGEAGAGAGWGGEVLQPELGPLGGGGGEPCGNAVTTG